MELINGITDEPKQHFKFQVNKDIEVDIYLTWKETQDSWFLDIIHGTFAIYGMKAIMSPNLLSQFNNKIPFGISIISSTSQDPIIKEAFSSGDWKFLFLDAADIAKYEAIYG